MPPEPGTSGFADLLRTLRRARGWTQEELAAKARVGVRTLRDLERARARPQRATADLLAVALGLDDPQRTEFTRAARHGAGTDLLVEGRGISLPQPPALIGRDVELTHLEAALRQAALVTLVGVAGVGKTSLALAAAHRVAHRHVGGVAGIVISEVSTEADILAAVATVFGVARVRDLPARLTGRPALLLVDAVDRAAEPTGAALRWLQGHQPAVRLLATGRHPTGITGEYVWPVEPHERWALRRLAQSRTRWSVELAEPLLAGGPPGLPQDVVVLLDRLTGLGLVSVRGSTAVRFRVLDVVRDFGREEAEREGEAADAAGRHARVIAGYAARTAAELVGPGQQAAVVRLGDIAIDIRAALVWAAEHDPDTALRLAAALPRWWRFRGDDRQGRRGLRRLLDHPGTAGADPTVRAWARLGLAQLAAEHGEGAAELPELEEAL